MIFDAFTFFNELDLLELRLSILDPHVDKFILVESAQTFSGLDKPLYYLKNIERFAKWNDKIIHIIAPGMEIKETAFERHWLCYELIEACLNVEGQPEDIAFCSDLDEIWNPEVLSKVDEDIHSLAQYNYSYWLNNRSSEQWVGTLMSKIKNIYPGYNKKYRTVKPNILENGGSHFTNMGGVEQLTKKIEAYDHTEANIDWVKDGLKARMENGIDYLGRVADYQGNPFTFYVEEDKWPQYLKDNKEKYATYLRPESL